MSMCVVWIYLPVFPERWKLLKWNKNRLQVNFKIEKRTLMRRPSLLSMPNRQERTAPIDYGRCECPLVELVFPVAVHGRFVARQGGGVKIRIQAACGGHPPSNGMLCSLLTNSGGIDDSVLFRKGERRYLFLDSSTDTRSVWWIDYQAKMLSMNMKTT